MLQRVQVGGPRIDFPLIQNRLARMYVAMGNGRRIFLRTMHEMIYGCQTRFDVCMGKLACAEMGTWVSNDAIAILGGCGYMREYVVERPARNAKLVEIGAGTAEMQMLTMDQDLATTWKP